MQSSRAMIGAGRLSTLHVGCSVPRSNVGAVHRRRLRCKAEQSSQDVPADTDAAPSVQANLNLDKEVSKFARSAATTFAPRPSGASKNPAYPGSTLYKVFEVQAWLGLAVGGLLSFNVLFPSDQPDIARLLGMWSMWMFTVPSLRARDCPATEKDALNVLFLAIPLLNVALPFLWKSFPFIYSADCVVMAGVYAWKGLLPWQTSAPSAPPSE